ncbi:hypothetical protein [Shewanella surugensis]|uniref:Uncharacterized protein n=1 Tax=Shewanella surugensis TaxID=212020 RepID=A0ABT0L8U7_9GAMM|nr:hypothetical protein [Shewanella surugensis]MCL1124127.1 hypothetical protein [Shewanella surugensis]
MDVFLLKLDFVLILIEIFLFLTIVYYSSHSILSVYRGGGNKLNEIETSIFITSLLVLIFHTITSYLSSKISGLDTDTDTITIRIYFYSFLVLAETLWFLSVISIHRVSNCHITKISRLCLYLSPLLILTQSLRGVERVFYDTNELLYWYKFVVTFSNISTVTLLSLYPLYKIIGLIEFNEA